MRSPVLRTAIVAAALAAGAPPLLGQASASTAVTVSAQVVHGLLFVKASDVDFGVVPAGSGPNVLLATDAGVGRLNLFGQNGRTVTVTISAPAALTSGANALPFVGAASVNESADDPAGATPATVGPSFTMKLRDQGPAKSQRVGYIYLHGAITVGPAVPQGVYTGTITVTAEQ